MALQEGNEASEAAIIELANGDDHGKIDPSDEPTEPSVKPITIPVVSAAAIFGLRRRYMDWGTGP